MRTTLDIDDDVLAAAKELAFRQNTTTGRAISDLARRALAEASLGKPTIITVWWSFPGGAAP
jgi:hypothetical protein